MSHGSRGSRVIKCDPLSALRPLIKAFVRHKTVLINCSMFSVCISRYYIASFSSFGDRRMSYCITGHLLDG